MIIDLCSGNGRWPDDDVIRIDMDRRTRPTILADIRYLPLRPGLKPKLVHASPPCLYVSKARRWRWGWNPKGVAESFRLLAACYDAFDYLEGQTCTLEQPAGLSDLLGHKITFRYNKADIKNATTNFYSNNKSLKRAMIPQEVRQRILEAC
jgi:hypothetical protein